MPSPKRVRRPIVPHGGARVKLFVHRESGASRRGRRRTRGASGDPARPLVVERLEGRLVFAAPAVGMNLDTVVDYGAAWTFTDAFQSSRDWFTMSYNTATGVESWSGGGTASVDAKGWPTEL